MKTLLVAAVLAVATMTSFAGNNGKFVYKNVENVNNQLTEQTVYRADDSGKFLTPTIKYSFVYDSQNRISVKEACNWDGGSETWQPAYRWTYEYNEGGYTISYSTWNSERNAYNPASQRSEYKNDPLKNEMSIRTNTFDATTNEWQSSVNCSVASTFDNLIALGK